MTPIEPRIGVRASRIVAVLAVVIGLPTLIAPPAGAAVGTCKVTNPRTNRVYIGSGSNLQTAISAAVPGTNLRVRGLCVGNFTIGAKLELSGRSTASYPTPTLDGNGSGPVLSVGAVLVILQDLTITNGFTTGSGGGIANAGTLTLMDASSVSGNAAAVSGGGVANTGTLTLLASSVSGNKSNLGGGIWNEGGSVTLHSSSVGLNEANRGGGVYNTAGGTLALMGSASVSGNAAGFSGGGILNDAGSIEACSGWSGAISPNTPNDPPTPTVITC